MREQTVEILARASGSEYLVIVSARAAEAAVKALRDRGITAEIVATEEVPHAAA
jgi:hypothetical protein